jgi:septal ring factor EnvC (AmiA/AmiB activator)
MKNFLQNLLVFFALCLCALLAFQWVRETDLRKNVQKLTDANQDKSQAIQNLQANVKRDEAEIQRLDGLRNQLTETVKTNNIQIANLSRDLEKATNEVERAHEQIEVYKDALKKANDNIVKQNEDIKKQNEELKKVAEDRNEVVQKFNKLSKDFNDLVDKWNAQQAELASAATNSAKKK